MNVPRGHFAPRHTAIRWLRSVILVGVVGSVAVPANASPEAAISPAAGRALIEQATARASAALPALRSGRLSDAVLATARLAKIDVAPVAASAPVALPAEAAAQLARLPLPIRGPVTSLFAAVLEGGRLSKAAIRGRPDEIRSAERAFHRALLVLPGIAQRPDAAARLMELNDRYRGLVDSPALFAAALHVARAIDDARPALQAFADASVPTPRRVVGCDLANAPPYVCVGGSGNNTYDRDYMLLIDTSNADTHLHAAGGADPTGTPGFAASVTLDFNGTDTYTTSVPAASGARVVHGSGSLGGIGFLVDTNGVDVYTATATAPGASANGQAYSFAGFGMLGDFNGSDTRTLSARGPGDRSVQGQGYAVLGGGSVVIDSNGNDVVRLEALPEPTDVGEGEPLAYAGSASASGFGIAAFGSGAIFSNGGGDDRFEAVAPSPPLPPDESRPVAPATAGASGAGFGVFGGAALASAAGGATTWSLTASVSAPRVYLSAVEGFGAGAVGGFGALLDDGGGNDTYRLESRTHAVRRLRIDDSCRCSGVRAVAELTPFDELTGAFTNGLGESSLGGVALVRDDGGNDSYTSIAEVRAEAEAVDERTVLVPPTPEDPVEGAEAVAEGLLSEAFLASQAYAALGGASSLVDEAGDDSYRVEATNRAEATARALHPDAPELASAASGDVTSRAQAGSVNPSYAELRDMAGEDRYEALASAAAVADPPGLVAPGAVLSSVQASVELAVAVLLDEGGTDAFTASPPDPACSGERGRGTWQDCGQGLGLGTND